MTEYKIAWFWTTLQHLTLRLELSCTCWCSRKAGCRYEFVIVQGDLAAAFCTSKKASSSSVLRLSYFIARCSAFQMSTSRKTCNGGQPQRRKSVCGAQYGGECGFSLPFWLSDHVICVPALIESRTNLETFGKHGQQTRGGLIRKNAGKVSRLWC